MSCKGSCCDVLISFFVDYFLLFEGDVDGCVLDLYLFGWMELGNVFLCLEVVIIELSSNCFNVYWLYFLDVCFFRKKLEVVNLF